MVWHSHADDPLLQSALIRDDKCPFIFLLYKAEKPSVYLSAFFPRQAGNSAVSAPINA